MKKLLIILTFLLLALPVAVSAQCMPGSFQVGFTAVGGTAIEVCEFGVATCPNSVCDAGETPLTCPADCPDVCGDGLCTGAETNATCLADCPPAGGGFLATPLVIGSTQPVTWKNELIAGKEVVRLEISPTSAFGIGCPPGTDECALWTGGDVNGQAVAVGDSEYGNVGRSTPNHFPTFRVQTLGEIWDGINITGKGLPGSTSRGDFLHFSLGDNVTELFVVDGLGKTHTPVVLTDCVQLSDTVGGAPFACTITSGSFGCLPGNCP